MAECYGWKDLLSFTGNSGKFYPGQCDYFGGSTVLPQAIGWVIVVAFGGGESSAEQRRQRRAYAALCSTTNVGEGAPRLDLHMSAVRTLISCTN
jgi:hypothetical protein